MHTQGVELPAAPPGRFARNLRSTSAQGCQVALLGLPDDTGVRLNFGRAGAALGPRAFRQALCSFGTDFDAVQRRTLSAPVFDAGDVVPAPGADEAALFETHARVEAAAHELHAAGLLVVGIGGGHDLSLPTLSAYSRHLGRPLGGINVDAHLDVRKRVGSGMPFRRLIDGGQLDPTAFVELGLGRFANEREDFEWLAARGAELVMADTVLHSGVQAEALLDRALHAGAGFLSIDLDGIDSAFAPGVSARNPSGLRVEHAAALAEAAGARPEIGHFDVMELCPPHDVDARTARIAAYLFLAFMAGFERRRA